MNLHEIISQALLILGLGSQAHVLDAYADEFKMYANEAVKQISRKFRQTRTDIVQLSENQEFDVSALSHVCAKVCVIQDENGIPLHWMQSSYGSGLIHVSIPVYVIEADDEPASVRVTYEFYPKKLELDADIPELPEFAHDPIPYYIAAQHKFRQDGSASAQGQYQLAEFNRMVADLPVPSYGERASYKLHNWNRGLI